MPLIQSGKTFNDGEQLTAGKLNQMFSDASLSTAGVDGTSIIVNANDVLAVRSINSSRIDSGAVITDKLPDSTDKTDGVTFAKMQKISSGKILGRTSANDGLIGESFDFKDEDDMSSNSATALASQQSIKAYVTAMRPKFVSLTGGTTDLVKTTASVSTAEYTYNIADFTSSDSDFGTSKIVALIVQGFTSSNQGQNNVQVRLPNDKFTTICSTSADSSADFTQDHGSTNIPINSGQSSIVIRHSVSDAQTNAAVSTIKGVIIHPGL
jgi:hypothetical protein